MTKQTSRNKAFTLVEILIAIIIIGILAGSLLLTMENVRAKSEASKIVSDLRNLKSAAILYCLDKGEIPDTISNQGWSLLSVTVLQPYIDMDLSSYKLSGINSEGLTTSSFDSNVKKGYCLYLMGSGSGGYSSEIGKLLFVSVWVGDKSIKTKNALESMAQSIPLYKGSYTEYLGQQKTGPVPYYEAHDTNNVDDNLIVIRVY